jgi:hypothetical protein
MDLVWSMNSEDALHATEEEGERKEQGILTVIN